MSGIASGVGVGVIRIMSAGAFSTYFTLAIIDMSFIQASSSDHTGQ